MIKVNYGQGSATVKTYVSSTLVKRFRPNCMMMDLKKPKTHPVVTPRPSSGEGNMSVS